MTKHLLRPSRRDLLRGGAALLGVSAMGLPIPRLAHAATPTQRNFVFVFARGGWDTTRVFSPMFHAAGVDSEPDAATVTLGDLQYVGHPARQNVTRFFDRWGDRAAILDGMLVRSVNHNVCERIVLTGASTPGAADWPTILASEHGTEFALPNIILDGPSQPGNLHRYSSIVGNQGQLQELLDGEVFSRMDTPINPLDAEVRSAADAALRARVARRVAAGVTGPDAAMYDAVVDGLDRVERLRADADLVQFRGESTTDQVLTACDMLEHGVARCVCIARLGFDTHSNNELQSSLLDDVFFHVDLLMDELTARPGRHAATLADETVVVVLSEMGRTPYVNKSNGKDHWPYTAAMLVGPGVAGGRRVGGYDDYLNGRAMDLATGSLTASGTVVSSRHLGATLLQLGGVDPAAWVPGIDPIGALLG